LTAFLKQDTTVDLTESKILSVYHLFIMP